MEDRNIDRAGDATLSSVGADALVVRGGDPLPSATQHSVSGTDRSDVFIFRPGTVDGTTITNFSEGDALVFSGFGDGAIFAQVGNTDDWVIYSPLNNREEILSVANNYIFHPDDYLFI